MKFTDVFQSLLKKKDDGVEYFFSLMVDVDAAAVAVWRIEALQTPHIISFAHGKVKEDSWDARIAVVDRLLSAAEEKVGSGTAITKTVFGLSGEYLTSEGNIAESVQPHLKKLTKMLELSPAGFVPLSQAIVFQLRKEEGVPSSIILIGCSQHNAHVTIFRVGKQMSADRVRISDDPAVVVEEILKSHQEDSDVLPSRMLLYGGDSAVLEEVRAKLLKHPWPTRANFLHFPKIEILSIESLLTAVSLAGASELASEMTEHEAADATTIVAQPSLGAQPDSSQDEEPEFLSAEADPDGLIPQPEIEGVETLESTIESLGKDVEKAESTAIDEESNVALVTPESLGFRTQDLPSPHPVRHEDMEQAMSEQDEEDGEEESGAAPKFSLPFKLPSFSPRMFQSLAASFSRVRLPKMRGSLPFIIIAVVLVILCGLAWYELPHATVTVLVLPQSVEESTALSVNQATTVVDPTGKVIPGKKLEKSLSGEKTIAVTGKKNIGDPAKGAVVIYNKVTSGKTFAKGTVLTANNLSFTLDADISIASASEAIGSITFGKATAQVTAKEIGPNSNLPVGSEFAFAGVSATSVSARNDAAFTGGTSKQVTVVSRTDQDSLVKALTDDLVGQAKTQLAQSAAGGERLIDATIKTVVSDKTFDAEVDQQAKELHGKITITVSGLSVNDEDIKGLLTSLVTEKVPSGYTLSPDQTTVSVSNVVVKKDGSISLTAKLVAIALPKLDSVDIKKQLIGKDVTMALSILKKTTGVAGAEFRFRWSPTTGKLPMNPNNIEISVMTQQ